MPCAQNQAQLSSQLQALTTQAWADQCQNRRQSLENTPTNHICAPSCQGSCSSTALCQMNALLEQQNSLLCQILSTLNGLAAASLAHPRE